MKALSVKNPWAMLIAHGIKDIENRTWKTTHRGRIYIHAGKDYPYVTLTDEQENQIRGDLRYNFIKRKFTCSAIIGEVNIIDCVLDHPSIWAEKSAPGEKPIWNWVLGNSILYEQLIDNVKGALNLWNYTKP